MSEKTLRNIVIAISFLCTLGIAMSFLFILNSCTISFQNVSTHGSATDLIDENQKADADVSPNVEIPMKP